MEVNGDVLPSTILLQTFSYLNRKQLCCRAAVVCKRWYTLANHDSLWHRLDITLRQDVSDEQILSAINAVASHAGALRILNFYIRSTTCPPAASDPQQVAFLATVNGSAFHQLAELEYCVNRWVTPPIVDAIITQTHSTLKSLSLEGCGRLNDECVLKIGQRCQRLQSLSLAHCEAISDGSVFELFSLLPTSQLHTIDINGVLRVTDETVVRLAERQCGSLTKLLLDGEELTDQSVLHGVVLLRHLTFLNISFACNLTDLSLEAISTSLTHLTHLHIRKAKQLTSGGITKFFGCSPHLSRNLTHLKFHEIPAIDSACAVALAGCLPALEVLCLDWCYNIDDVGFSEMADKCYRIIALSLVGVRFIKAGALSRKHAFPCLRFLDVRNCNNVDDLLLSVLIYRKPNPVYVVDYYGTLHGDYLDSPKNDETNETNPPSTSSADATKQSTFVDSVTQNLKNMLTTNSDTNNQSTSDNNGAGVAPDSEAENIDRSSRTYIRSKISSLGLDPSCCLDH